MAGQTLGPLPPYWTIGAPERVNLARAMKRPLSGYIGGYPSMGYWVNKLADDWKAEFNVNFAIPCNSATSGLMAACMAADIGPGDEVWVSTYTMSATATCAMMLGATVKLMDIEPKFFMMTPGPLYKPMPKAIIITNLFGCGAMLPQLKSFCDQFHIILIEDNAQAPYATVGGQLTGTIGHIGVFSLNVHKHIQCGEGGVVVTNDSDYANKIEGAINHGELSTGALDHRRGGGDHSNSIGGNFRMTEPIAAIACAQLKKGFGLVQNRIALAERITDIFREVSFVEPPQARFGEVHAFYMWAGKITGDNAAHVRADFLGRLNKRGVPIHPGYSTPLHRLFEEDVTLPVAEEMEDQRLMTFEVCAYDMKSHHLNTMRDIILEEAEQVEGANIHGTDTQRGSGSAIAISGSL